jgi:MoaA/NifB/PqqE/SkfB family radical SAM enzyme
MEHYLEEKRENLRHALEAIGQTDQMAGAAASRPLLLHLEITTRCNLRCLKCGHATDPPDSPRIAPRHLQYGIVESFDRFFAAAARVHTFGYGEMFLYGRLQRLVERLKHYECIVDGITNGALVGEKEVDWLVEYGYDELTFSIDGVEPATMQRLRGVDVERIWNTLAYLERRKRECHAGRPRVIVNFVAQSDNYLELPRLVRKLAGLNVYFLGVNTLHRPGPSEPESDAYAKLYREFTLRNAPRPEVEAAFEEARQLAAAAHIGFALYIDLDAEYTAGPANGLVQIVPRQDGNGDRPRPETLPPYYCAYPWMSLYVHADTDARVCCYMQGRIGTVSSGDDLEKVWNNGVVTAIRESVSKGEVHPSCDKCVRAGRYQHSFVDLEDIQRVLAKAAPSDSC